MKSLLTVALLTLTGTLLSAQDDRDRQTPVGATWGSGMSQAAAQNLAGQGWRFTDIEIESTAPFSFTVSAVQNSGSYFKNWAWYIGVTATQLGSYLSTNNARLVDLEPYDDNGTTRFVAIMISNTGVDQKSWQWGYDMTAAQVNSSVSAFTGRLIQLERYTRNSQTLFAIVMIANTGADYRNWGHLFGATAAAINQNVSQYANRIYGIERVATDSYDVILVPAAGFGHWYYFDQSATQVTNLLEQNIGRLIDVERHSSLLGTRFNVVLLDNANDLERLARQQFVVTPSPSLGTYGFYLKQVNGAVLAQMRPVTTFEPGSQMATLYHFHAMREVMLTNTTLLTMINKPSACGVSGSSQRLESMLYEMMVLDDDMAALGVANYFTNVNVRATAALIGMVDTDINHTLGCANGPVTPNATTLRDMGELFERVVNGSLLNQRDKFYERMHHDLALPTWGFGSFDAQIGLQGALLGYPTALVDAFRQAMRTAYRKGYRSYGGVHNYSESGWMSVPFKNSAGVITYRDYVFGPTPVATLTR